MTLFLYADLHVNISYSNFLMSALLSLVLISTSTDTSQTFNESIEIPRIRNDSSLNRNSVQRRN